MQDSGINMLSKTVSYSNKERKKQRSLETSVYKLPTNRNFILQDLISIFWRHYDTKILVSIDSHSGCKTYTKYCISQQFI